MSYARWGEGSAVYVYADVSGGVVCCGCNLNVQAVGVTYTDFFGIVHEAGEMEWFGPTLAFHSADALIEHLREHVADGQQVPADLLDATTYDPSDFEETRDR